MGQVAFSEVILRHSGQQSEKLVLSQYALRCQMRRLGQFHVYQATIRLTH